MITGPLHWSKRTKDLGVQDSFQAPSSQNEEARGDPSKVSSALTIDKLRSWLTKFVSPTLPPCFKPGWETQPWFRWSIYTDLVSENQALRLATPPRGGQSSDSHCLLSPLVDCYPLHWGTSSASRSVAWLEAIEKGNSYGWLFTRAPDLSSPGSESEGVESRETNPPHS